MGVKRSIDGVKRCDLRDLRLLLPSLSVLPSLHQLQQRAESSSYPQSQHWFSSLSVLPSLPQPLQQRAESSSYPQSQHPLLAADPFNMSALNAVAADLGATSSRSPRYVPQTGSSSISSPMVTSPPPCRLRGGGEEGAPCDRTAVTGSMLSPWGP